MKHNIMLIGTALVEDLRKNLGKQYNLIAVNNPSRALTTLTKSSVPAVLVDHVSPPSYRLEVVYELKAAYPDLNVFLIGACESSKTQHGLGICNWIPYPFDKDSLLNTLRQACERIEPQIESDYSEMIGESPAMMKVFRTIGKIADHECSVLICGEHGTGKELVARRLHFQSSRRNHPFIPVDCGGLVPTLLESEFFGHEKGAFTGAYQTNKGRFERAGKGTIFLDEIGDIPPSSQAKLLRALQEREFERVGGNHAHKIRARVIAATNKDLQVAVRKRLFREDLYYRLSVINIFLPRLKCRTGDIPLLTNYFLKRYRKVCRRERISISGETMKIFEKYPWPGNVRELEHEIWRAICLCEEDVIEPRHLSLGLRGALVERRRVTLNKKVGELSLPEAVESVESRMIYDALKKTNHVKAKAARLLGITERMLSYKIDKWRIDFGT